MIQRFLDHIPNDWWPNRIDPKEKLTKKERRVLYVWDYVIPLLSAVISSILATILFLRLTGL